MGPHKSTWHRQCLTCTIPCSRPRPGLEVSKNSVAWTVSWSRWTGSALSSFRTWTPNQPLLSKASPSRSPTPSSFTSNTNGEVVTHRSENFQSSAGEKLSRSRRAIGQGESAKAIEETVRARSRHALFTTWKSRISQPSTSSMPPGCIGSHSMHWSLVPSSPSMPCMLPWSRTSTAWLDLSKQQQGSYYMGTRSTILCHHGLATAGLTPLCAVKFSTLYCTQMCWFLVCPSAKATGQVRQRGLIHKKKDASARAPGRRTARRNPLHGRVLHGYAWLHVNYMATSKTRPRQ